ncbi:MAG: hypothetical protein SVM86_01730 [Candidatus Cloacimonadota bacterium]|nr:hypothetical protein [Candidatus Cloacimonadota bacterium]
MDYYKLFFQGSYGPSHYIKNKEASKNYIEKELEKVSLVFPKQIFRNISFLSPFYRIDLQLLILYDVSIEEFNELFFRSSLKKIKINKEKWLVEWKKIERLIVTEKIPIPDLKADIKKLDRRLAMGEIVFSHSSEYHIHHQPHYRIIHSQYIPFLKEKASVKTEA